MIASKFFESKDGRINHINRQLSICESHRRIYDLLVMNLQDRPDLLKKLLPLLEGAFKSGRAMFDRLSTSGYVAEVYVKDEDPVEAVKAGKFREQRIDYVDSTRSNSPTICFLIDELKGINNAHIINNAL